MHQLDSPRYTHSLEIFLQCCFQLATVKAHPLNACCFNFWCLLDLLDPAACQLRREHGVGGFRHSLKGRCQKFCSSRTLTKSMPAGCASMFGNMYEIGPDIVTPDLELQPWRGAWNRIFGLLFIDQPIGTGYSIAGVLSPLSCTLQDSLICTASSTSPRLVSIV